MRHSSLGRGLLWRWIPSRYRPVVFGLVLLASLGGALLASLRESGKSDEAYQAALVRYGHLGKAADVANVVALAHKDCFAKAHTPRTSKRSGTFDPARYEDLMDRRMADLLGVPRAQLFAPRAEGAPAGR